LSRAPELIGEILSLVGKGNPLCGLRIHEKLTCALQINRFVYLVIPFLLTLEDEHCPAEFSPLLHDFWLLLACQEFQTLAYCPSEHVVTTLASPLMCRHDTRAVMFRSPSANHCQKVETLIIPKGEWAFEGIERARMFKMTLGKLAVDGCTDSVEVLMKCGSLK
jgi:hypothetical protein